MLPMELIYQQPSFPSLLQKYIFFHLNYDGKKKKRGKKKILF